MQKPIVSSTGGVITFTATGLIHTARTGAYSGKIAQSESKQTKGKK